MNETLRDQLRKAGLVNRDQHSLAKNEVSQKKVKRRVTQTTNNRSKSSPGNSSKRLTNPAQTLSPHSHLSKSEREVVRRFLREHRLNAGQGEIPFYFQEGSVIRKIWVTLDQRQQLMQGKLVIVPRNERYYVLDDANSEQLRMLDPKVTIISVEGGIHTDEDDLAYRDFPVPEDLIW